MSEKFSARCAPRDGRMRLHNTYQCCGRAPRQMVVLVT